MLLLPVPASSHLQDKIHSLSEVETSEGTCLKIRTKSQRPHLSNKNRKTLVIAKPKNWSAAPFFFFGRGVIRRNAANGTARHSVQDDTTASSVTAVHWLRHKLTRCCLKRGLI